MSHKLGDVLGVLKNEGEDKGICGRIMTTVTQVKAIPGRKNTVIPIPQPRRAISAKKSTVISTTGAIPGRTSSVISIPQLKRAISAKKKHRHFDVRRNLCKNKFRHFDDRRNLWKYSFLRCPILYLSDKVFISVTVTGCSLYAFTALPFRMAGFHCGPF